MQSRVGYFFLWLGVILFLLYFISEFARTPVYWVLLSGLIISALGIYNIRASIPPSEPVERFRLLRKLLKRRPREPMDRRRR